MNYDDRRQTRDGARNSARSHPETSYDEAARLRRRERGTRFGGHGPGRDESGIRRVAVCLSIIAIIACIRLVTLQVFQAGSLAKSASEQRTNIIALPGKRGTIYDRNGNVLAKSQDCKTIYCNPSEVSDAMEAARIIASVLGGEPSDYISKLKGDTTFAYIKRQVDTADADNIQKSMEAAGVRGVYYLDDSKRIYPYGAIGGQVLGTVGVDGDGLSGLEQYYNDILKGENGQMILERGVGGTPIAGAVAESKPAKEGTDIVISIDINVQQVAEENIVEGVETYSANSGTVVVTNPQNGEILAICSTPLLDPTKLEEAEPEAFALKPVATSYEPGSIFKVLTAAIGVENHLINAKSSWEVPPAVTVGDDQVKDDDGRDYNEVMTLREILSRSSNTGIALIAQEEIGEKRFAKGVELFHIGTKTGVDYPGESAGIVRKLKDYDGSSLGAMSFGQGLALPMVQMVEAFGSIANDGTLYTPHFLLMKGGEEVKWPAVGKTVSKETCDEVTDMMRTVIDEGTGVNANVEGYDVAGKTGTGEQAAEEGGGYIAGLYVSSLIGFANADNPEVLVYVGLNGTPFLASGSAAHIFSSIMSEALTDMNVQPKV